ncbi:MAG TPA: DUF255 domain-containing protein [Pseudomonadota bacterium]|nr:DUF255 domain-containing protein [Pseudomonadota bacterium]
MKPGTLATGRALGLWLALTSACAGPQLAPTAPPEASKTAGAVPPGTPIDEDIANARAQKRAASFTWEEFGPAALERARASGKLVLLDCVATWCHWCHVMDDTTYTDPELGALIRDQVVAVRVDVDARPDIATRYEDFGWPATVVFNPQGEELGKFRGYMTAKVLKGILEEARAQSARGPVGPRERPALVETPAPAALMGWVGVRVVRDLDLFYDGDQGGWGRGQKLPIGGNIEVELLRGAHGDAAALRRARQSLDKQRALIDPVWGGMYQYSVGGVWNKPHFEKRMPIQTEALHAYARALATPGLGESQDRIDAERIIQYLHSFLRNRDGLYLVSQDADLGGHEKEARFVDGHIYYELDDAHRRELGIPRIDDHVYSYENGLAIAAIATFAARLGSDPRAGELLQAVQRAAEQLTRTHVEPDGTVRREAVVTSSLRFLADAAALGRAFTVLATVTAKPAYRQLAEKIAAAMWTHFFDAKAGLLWVGTVDPAASGVFARREHSFWQNTLAARFLGELAAAPGVGAPQRVLYRTQARALLTTLSIPSELAAQGRLLGDYVLALDTVGLLPWSKPGAP